MIFDLEAANRVMPKLQALTADAAHRTEGIIAKVQTLTADDPERDGLERLMRAVVEEWAAQVKELGAEAKGLWLVDFDNGEGYWCWRHPEPSLEYCHSYEEGYSNRQLITPPELH